VKVLGVFPDNSDDPIVYPVAATVNAKPETIQYLAFLRSAAAKDIRKLRLLGAGKAHILNRRVSKSIATSLLVPAGTIELIENRHDLLTAFGIWIHVLSGLEQR
jgi:hypothetical protein